MIEPEIPSAERDAYKKVIEYLANKKDHEMIGVALETAKSNPEFFIRALQKVREKAAYVNVGDMTANIYLSGSATPISIKGMADVIEYVCIKKMVNAIKELRMYTGLGLKEAKDICDYIRFEVDAKYINRHNPIMDRYELQDNEVLDLINYTVRVYTR